MRWIAAALVEIRHEFPAQPHPGAAKVLVGLLAATVLLGAFFWTLESLWPEDRGQPSWRGASSRTDLFYWVFDFFVNRRIVGASLFLAVLILALLHVPRATIGIARLPLWLQVPLMLLLGDLIAYWVHRAMHRSALLWRFHAVHHSSVRLDWLASARVHPLESVVSKLAAAIPMFLLGFAPGLTAVYAPFLGIYPIFLHCNLDWGYGKLGYAISSPAFHRWHHAADLEARDRNFSGLFPVFDYLFGTAYFPRGRHPQRYGVDGEPMPAALLPQLAYPFRRPSV